MTGASDLSVGWLGLGRMGTAMAGRLLDAGRPITVWNRTASKLDPLIDRGARAAATIGELAHCDVVFVMVAGSADLAEVACGPGGLLDGQTRPRIIVDCSTVSASASREVRAAASAVGTQFLAAPVSGNPHVVAEGAASLVVSGPRDAFDAVEPTMQAIAARVVYAGEEEQARLVKLCHNLFLGMMVEALCEVTSLAEKGGTDRAAFLDFLNGTVIASEWIRRRSKDLIALDWTPTFTTELLRKDFDLGMEMARGLEVPLPVGSAVHQLIQAAIGHGHRHDDFLSLYDVQSAAAGILRPA